MERKSSILGAIASVVALTCAIIVTFAVAKRELMSDSPSFRPRSVRDYAPVPVEDWDLLTNGGLRIGSDSPVLTIVEFGDFQCPACKRFHEAAFLPLMSDHGDEVALIFRHWPLPYHPQAYSAARMAVCAEHQGKFESMATVLYRWQDSLEVSSPKFFATRASLPDLESFGICTLSTEDLPTVERDSELARRLGGVGTPTLIMNGQLLRYVPDSAGLDAIFEQARKGELN